MCVCVYWSCAVAGVTAVTATVVFIIGGVVGFVDVSVSV